MLYNQNTQDFYNLVHVYLDAVLFPRAVADPFVHAQACLFYPWAAVPRWPHHSLLPARLISVRSPFLRGAHGTRFVCVCLLRVCRLWCTRHAATRGVHRAAL